MTKLHPISMSRDWATGVQKAASITLTRRSPQVSPVSACLQKKLTINAPGDKYEQEADQTAALVTSMAEPPQGMSSRISVPRQRPKATGTIPPVVDDVLKSSGQPLDASTRDYFEPRFGHDFSHVRVHTNQQAAASAAAVQARAYTVGSDIVFGAGEARHGFRGSHLLAHELTHVVQQTGGTSGLLTPQPIGLSRKPAIDPKVLEDVQEVESREVQAKDNEIGNAESDLEKRLQARLSDIENELANLPPSTKAAAKKKAALEAERKRTLQQVLDKPDQYINSDRRKKVVNAVHTRDRLKNKRQQLDQTWHKYDEQFAAPEVTETLASKGFTNAELKALVGQESSDLTNTDLHGDKAGIGQIGKKETEEAGGKPADRLNPKKAIPLAAQVLIDKANYLEKLLIVVPQGADYKRLVLSSYNAGQSTIAEAQRQAKTMGRDPASWEQLKAGGKDSPLYKAMMLVLKPEKPERKFEEISEYPDKVLSRIPAPDKGD